ncbi:MAG: 3-hydroxyacyl-CoA dehydrogenase family protein [Ruminococcus sp.]|nr:3-hydroxyacyl-CoA dehydrogenase family protein [Ruminococcus sp.]
MNIGITGYGKMGKDIFSFFFDNLKNAGFTVLVRSGAEEYTAAVVKTLDKQLRRKKLTQEEYEAKKSAFRFTCDAAELAGCDVVIETISENLEAKNSLFRDIADIVSGNCLLMTNTSSLNIEKVFEGVPDTQRCMGMHFFYPVKLAEFVELNLLADTSEDALKIAESLITGCGRRYIRFSGDYHVYLNQILSAMVSHGICLCDYFHTSVPALSASLEKMYTVAGVFDILDSVGLGLMAENQTNFRLERNKQLLGYGCEKMQLWRSQGCPDAPRSFLNFISQQEQKTAENCDNAPLYMAAYILSETAFALDEAGIDSDVLLEAVSSTLGTADTLPEMYRKYGAENLISALDDLYEKTGFASYKYNTDLFEKYYS